MTFMETESVYLIIGHKSTYYGRESKIILIMTPIPNLGEKCLVSKGTVVLRRSERETWKFGFIKRAHITEIKLPCEKFGKLTFRGLTPNFFFFFFFF